MTSMPDRYDIEARYVPALISSVPFLFLGYYYLNGLDGAFWQSAFTLTVGSVGLTTALLIVAIHFCRTIGKMIEYKMFNGGLTFPTTEFLLDTNTNLTQDRKLKIRKKIRSDFSIDLIKTTNSTDANRRHIHEAIGQIRIKLRPISPLILHRNIQFGMTRNLLSGCILAIIVSLLGLLISIVSSNQKAMNVSVVLIVGYLLLGLISWLLIKFTARQYAHTLYDEFLAS